MTKKKLETFKVGDKHAPRVKPSAGAHKGAQPVTDEPKETLGFARIEEVLDASQPGDVQRSLVQLTDALDTYMSDNRGQKERSQAKRAKMAVERTIDLLAYLFETKEAMIVSLTQTPNASSAGKKSGHAKRGT